jgi:hypothetical protein
MGYSFIKHKTRECSRVALGVAVVVVVNKSHYFSVSSRNPRQSFGAT